MKEKVTFDTQHCTSCRTCELACSFHHTGTFSPNKSSIEIKNTLLKDGRCTILFHLQANDGHLACDLCGGLDEPVCVKYCPLVARDELRKVLNMLLVYKKPDKKEAPM